MKIIKNILLCIGAVIVAILLCITYFLSSQNIKMTALLDLSGIGRYKIAEYSFAIPRNYLSMGKLKEGEVDSLLLAVQYPSMQSYPPLVVHKLHSDQVLVYLKFQDACPEKPCLKFAQSWYDVLTTFKATTWRTDKEVEESEADRALGMKHYDILQADEAGAEKKMHEVYYEGDSVKPKSWIICDVAVANPGCRTVYEYKPGLWADVTFRYQFLKQGRDVIAKTNQLLDQFLLEGESHAD